jgi:hypothetical protein
MEVPSAREEAPSGLRPRIEASVGGVRRQHAQSSWRALAASILLTAMVTGSSTWFVVGSQPTITVADSLVSDHIRALMAPGTSRCGVIGSPYSKALVQWPCPRPRRFRT